MPLVPVRIGWWEAVLCLGDGDGAAGRHVSEEIQVGDAEPYAAVGDVGAGGADEGVGSEGSVDADDGVS